MSRSVANPKRHTGMKLAWPALAAALLVAEAAGFVVLHQSMQDYRTPAALSGHVAYR